MKKRSGFLIRQPKLENKYLIKELLFCSRSFSAVSFFKRDIKEKNN